MYASNEKHFKELRAKLIENIKFQIDKYTLKGHIVILAGDMNDIIKNQDNKRNSKWLKQLLIDTAMTDTFPIKHPKIKGHTFVSKKGNKKKIDHITIDIRHSHLIAQTGIIHDSAALLDHSMIYTALKIGPKREVKKPKDRTSTANWKKTQRETFLKNLGPLLEKLEQENNPPQGENHEKWEEWQDNCYKALCGAYNTALDPLRIAKGKKWMNKQTNVYMDKRSTTHGIYSQMRTE